MTATAKLSRGLFKQLIVDLIQRTAVVRDMAVDVGEMGDAIALDDKIQQGSAMVAAILDAEVQAGNVGMA